LMRMEPLHRLFLGAEMLCAVWLSKALE